MQCRASGDGETMEVGKKKSRRLHTAPVQGRKRRKATVVLEDAGMPQLADVSDDKRYHDGSIGDTMRELQRASEELPQATSEDRG